MEILDRMASVTDWLTVGIVTEVVKIWMEKELIG